jgi:molybdopterin molybdotransferase
VNSYALSALVAEAGGEPIRHGIVPDQMAALQEAARKALRESDLVVITAGSSASARDLTAEAIRSLGEPGVLVHGVAIRPGKPTILAVAGKVPVIGLPGNPVSALVIARLFVVPVIRRLLGERGPELPARLTARLSTTMSVRVPLTTSCISISSARQAAPPMLTSLRWVSTFSSLACLS